ncbi:MlaD family protein [Phenylobacterium sp.]|jgi:phospholipid/cholesterol/gamma-HCH transport system substrate-binding protein|uniref:MlaD family protein n=1 Tax=Phenylobacterium sp. TaxID=1871053 RepID=UPI002F93B53E
MEKNANYAMVGLSALLLLMAALIFVVWLSRWQFRQENDLYDAVFDGPVRGLNQGGEVHFNGIKVGEVTKIALDRTNPTRVIARIRVGSEVPIRSDSYATLEPLSITGVSLIQITAGTPSRPLLKEVEQRRCEARGMRNCIPILRSQRSALSDLLAGGGTVLNRTIEVLDRANRVLSDQNIRTFSATLNDVQAVSAEVRARKAILADAQKTLQDIDAAAQEFTGLAQSGRQILDTDGRRTMRSAAQAADEARATAADLRALVAKLQAPTADFATNGLPQITAAAVQLQEAAIALERLANELQANGAGAVLKPKSKELEVQP